MSDPAVLHARAEADRARERFIGSLHALQTRLKPAALATDAWITARDAGETAASRAADAVSRRPVVAGAAAAGLAALVIRKPLARLFRGKRAK